MGGVGSDNSFESQGDIQVVATALPGGTVMTPDLVPD